MKTVYLIRAAIAALALGASATPAYAVTHILNLTGNVGDFTNFQQTAFGLNFDRYFLNLQGLDDNNAITVAQGDEINSTVTLDQVLTIPQSEVRTDLLQFLFGNGFSGAPVETSGEFNFFNGAALVGTFAYTAGTSSQLATFAAVFPPNNGAFSFDSFTNNLLITTLDQSATLNASSFNYNLVSNAAVPEPATWAMLIAGFGLVGGAMRRRTKMQVTYA